MKWRESGVPRKTHCSKPLGEADHLELELVLVRPKPGYRSVGFGLATEAGRCGPRLPERVGNRLQSDPTSVESVIVHCAVPRRDDVRVGGHRMFINDNPAVDNQASCFGQLDIR